MMLEQIELFGPLQEYWEGTRDQYIHLIKLQLANMQQTYTYMSSKLIEVHQSNVLDWIMHNLDPQQPVSNSPRNGLFHIHVSKKAIVNYFNIGKSLVVIIIHSIPNM